MFGGNLRGKYPKPKSCRSKISNYLLWLFTRPIVRLFQISHRKWDNVIEEESPCELPSWVLLIDIKTWLSILRKLQAVEVFSEFVQTRFKFPAKFRITPLAHLLPQAADLYLTKGGIPQWRVTSSWAALKRSIDSTLKGKPIPFGISPKADFLCAKPRRRKKGYQIKRRKNTREFKALIKKNKEK